MVSYENIVMYFSNFFNGLENMLPEKYKSIFGLLIYTIFIVLYSVFIWKFYHFLAKRNILDLNLKKYNYSENPGFAKFIAATLNIVEYIIILPFLVFFWFGLLSLFLLLLSKSESVYQVLLISAAIVASTRITAYISEDLSKDIAKMFPFTILALFLLDPNFFNVDNFFLKITEIPQVFNKIIVFIIFIFFIEIFLRGLYIIVEFIYSGDPKELPKIEAKEI